MLPIEFSRPEARRLAVASQGFGRKPDAPSVAHIRKLISRVHAFQIDSVNVCVRAHYVPAFARLGPYPMDSLDSMAYRKRELFEHWGHAACLMPVQLYPLLRYRMHTGQAHEYMTSRRGAYMAKVYAEVAERGPMAASTLSDPGKRSGNWWGWAKGKATLEHLYDSGLLSIAGRRGFERLYDITERVMPRAALDASVPPREEAMKQLICLGARAQGVGTFADITGYFMVDALHDRMPPGPHWQSSKSTGRAQPVAKRLVRELVEEGRLLPALVEGWNEPAYMHPESRVPRSVDARALLSPFDSLVWDRRRIHRMFGVRYTIELYVPPAKRVYGYYVFLFLLRDRLAARCDLKADRQRRVLMVQSAFLEPEQNARDVAVELIAELRQMQAWLKLDRIEVAERGDLAVEVLRGITSISRADKTSAAV